jgi:twinkle protein
VSQIFNEQDVIDFSQYMDETDHRQTVKSASLYAQGLLDHFENPPPVRHRYMPWTKTNRLIQFRPGEVSLWAGENGVGKSIITGQVALSLAAQDEKVGIASFEMKPMRTIARMARQWTHLNLSAPTYRDMDRQQLRDSHEQYRDWLKNKIWLYDKQGTVKWPNVIAMAKFSARELGCNQIFIDNLGKCVQGEDDYNGQKEFVDCACAVARDEDVHIHIVHHVKKPSSPTAKPDKYAIKGTGAITDQPDNVILVWRNKAKERQQHPSRDEADTLLIVDKQRNGDGWEGEIALWYEPISQQFVGSHDAKPMTFYGSEQ